MFTVSVGNISYVLFVCLCCPSVVHLTKCEQGQIFRRQTSDATIYSLLLLLIMSSFKNYNFLNNLSFFNWKHYIYMKVILKLSGFFFSYFSFCLMPFIYSHSKTIKHTFFQKLQLNTIKKMWWKWHCNENFHGFQNKNYIIVMWSTSGHC